MARKTSVYVDGEFHEALKAAASLQGLSLPEFMIRATRRALKAPDRKAVAARMGAICHPTGTRFSADEIRAMREEERHT